MKLLSSTLWFSLERGGTRGIWNFYLDRFKKNNNCNQNIILKNYAPIYIFSILRIRTFNFFYYFTKVFILFLFRIKFTKIYLICFLLNKISQKFKSCFKLNCPTPALRNVHWPHQQEEIMTILSTFYVYIHFSPRLEMSVDVY